LKQYNKPEFEFVQLSSEDEFAVVQQGSVCDYVGICIIDGVQPRTNA